MAEKAYKRSLRRRPIPTRFRKEYVSEISSDSGEEASYDSDDDVFTPDDSDWSGDQASSDDCFEEYDCEDEMVVLEDDDKEEAEEVEEESEVTPFGLGSEGFDGHSYNITGRMVPTRGGGQAAMVRLERAAELRKWRPMDEESSFKVHKFKGPAPGYKGMFGARTKSIDYFDIFFNHTILQLIVNQTNLYFTQSNPGTTFVELTIEELQAFFGMVIMISTKGVRVLRHIWSKLPYFHDKALASIMTRRRFFWISRNLHFNDNTHMPKDPNPDRLYKLRPILDHMKAAYQRHYNLSKHIAIDEAMVKFKGRHSGKQYDPSKPTKRGFKVWTLADSMTGYVYNFNVYMGRFGNPDNRDLGFRVVKGLITHNLHHCYHRLYCDRFFTSVPLLKDLKRIGMYCCGTVQHDRQGLPTEIVNLKYSANDMPRGESHLSKHKDGFCSYAWKDRKLIYFLSSAHSGDLPLTAVIRTIDQKGNRGEVPCPQACYDYNMYMGGVDRADQLRSYYCVDRKSRRWHMRLFWHIFDTTVTNAYIIHKEWQFRNKVPPTSLIMFRYYLAEQLMGDFSSRQRVGRPAAALSMRVNASHEHVIVDLRTEGFIIKRRCQVCLRNILRHETYFGCAQCDNVPLCNNSVRQCFENFHKNSAN
ncbi:piggyBac transposable element-derived protein 4-like [Anneissia japonica]|uniref:piggyBac transposable element-derived protein 4-like n=1 Tax=Anneissia japonica TaxID=1529436 RepID=UPI001425556B|nr:piggyBac transposable element-derived protein 4-like [Anneissia japonica]